MAAVQPSQSPGAHAASPHRDPCRPPVGRCRARTASLSLPEGPQLSLSEQLLHPAAPA